MSSFDVAAALDLPELPAYTARVEQKLTEILPADNPYLDEPITRLLQSGGKRLRPSLVIAVAASQAKNVDDKIISACAAVELLHLASLVHDDTIDNAASRHNTATVNRREGVNRAILVGDYLLAKALEQAALADREIAQTIAAAFAAMCDGQARELADIGNLNRTQASYLQAVTGKSAALFAAACRIGGICAGLPDSQIDALANFGENFGLSYQILDDVLDFIADPKSFGKPIGTDLRERNYTLPLIFGLASPNGKKLKTLLQKPETQATITNALMKSGDIEKAILEAGKYTQSTANALHDFGDTTTRLSNFPNAYLNWALENLTAPPYKNAIFQKA